MTRFTKQPIAPPSDGSKFTGAALAAHINELAAAIVSGHYDAELPVGAGAGLLRSRPFGAKIRMTWFDGASEYDLFELDPAAGTVTPLTITAAQIGALALGGGTVTGQITKDGSGIWGSYKSNSVAQSFQEFKKPVSGAAGYLGIDGGGIVSEGTGANFGIRSEGDLILASGGNSVKAKLDSAGRLTVANQPRVLVDFGGPSQYTPMNAGRLAFDNIVDSTGNDYDTANHIFTCPVDGWYRTHIHMLSDSGLHETFEVKMYKNEIPVTRLFTQGRTAAGGITIKCSANDTLHWIIHHQGINIYTGTGTNNRYSYVSYELIG